MTSRSETIGSGPRVVAIDGPAGSGKSSVSRAVARKRDYAYLDTGAAYRALTWFVLDRDGDPASEDDVRSALTDFNYAPQTDPESTAVSLGDNDVSDAIRDTPVCSKVSDVARVSAVRDALNDLFRRVIRDCDKAGIVVEGRDITTVVVPDASVRVLLTASEEVRANRREAQQRDNETKCGNDDLAARDVADGKIVDFMTPTEGVTVIDSSDLTLDETVDAVLQLVAEFDARVLREQLEGYELEEDDRDLLDRFSGDDELPEMEPVLPVLAIVGRPNVGKSALVNRILGRREAVVEDTPGVTRDRVSYRAEWNGRAFTVVDTGGWEPRAQGIDASVAAQAEVAIDLADGVLFVVDAHVGATSTDDHVVPLLRRAGKPVFLVANKVDDARHESQVSELWSVGLGAPRPVSALHGRGVADLLDEVVPILRSRAKAQEKVDAPRRVALIGRPNVGKSSLLNKAVGSERTVVNEQAGTTRDPVDEIVEIAGSRWCFVDTAGIRRRVHLQQGADFYATLRTSAALEKAEVAVVLLDVTQPVSEQDVRVIDLVVESGRALVLAFNKWDLIDDERRWLLEREIEQDLGHVSWAPRVNISARTGRHLEKLVPALEVALASWDMRIPTGKVNAFLADLTAEHPHPVRGGKQPRILFGTQAQNRPPTFVLFTTGFLDAGYRRFIQRRLRETYGFEGTPLVLTMRIRERRKR